MPNQFMLMDDQGAIREKFAIGDTIFLSAQGLLPCTTFTFSLGRKGYEDKRELLARYVSDRHGTLPMTVLIPHFGLLHPGSEPSCLTHEEAAKIFAGQPYTIHIAAIKQEASFSHTLRFTIDDGLDRNPRVFASDRHGRLVTGFEVGDSEIGVTLRSFPPGCARIFVVRRQFDWRVGDPVEPVRMRSGAPAVATVHLEGSGSHYVRLARASELGTGSYQFIARSYLPGWYEADKTTLLHGDVVSDRRFASLVVRNGFRRRYGYDNGIALTPQVAGRPLPHRPYFHLVDNFPKGTDVYAALDPDALPAGLISKRAAIYVIQHKTAAQWSDSNSLSDISGAGMTSAVKVVPIVSGCVNWNTTLVWPNPKFRANTTSQ